jgi:hypothetical protein
VPDTDRYRVSAVDPEGANDAFTVTTFVPAQADICRFLKVQTAPNMRKLLIRMTPNNDLRIRNAWVRGSNPLCGTKKVRSVPETSFTGYTDDIVNTFAVKGLGPGSTLPSTSSK